MMRESNPIRLQIDSDEQMDFFFISDLLPRIKPSRISKTYLIHSCPRRHGLVVRVVACGYLKQEDLGSVPAQSKWFFLLSSGIGGRNKWIQTQ